MQRKKQKIALFVLAALGLGLFLNQSQGQASPTRADVPVEMTAAEGDASGDTLAESGTATQGKNICNPVYCQKNKQICILAGCYQY